jgi:hypothetical protein
MPIKHVVTRGFIRSGAPSPTTATNPQRKTLASLKTAVRNSLDEPIAAFWSDSQMIEAINRAKDRVWMDVKRLKDDYLLSSPRSTDGTLSILGVAYAATNFRLVAGTTEYELPFDVTEVKLIEVVTSGYEWVRFVHRDLNSDAMRGLRSSTEHQAPNTIAFDLVAERTLLISPPLDMTLDLRLWYVPILADLSADEDQLEMPHPLYMAVEHYAVAHLQVMDRDETSAVWEQKGSTIVANFMGSHRRQTMDPEYVVPYLSGW